MTTNVDEPFDPMSRIPERTPDHPAAERAPALMLGRLPHLTAAPVSTPWYDLGRDRAQLGVALGGIVTFSGDSGTGKTTTAVAIASDSPRRFVYMQLRYKAGTNEVAESLYKALHNGRTLGGRAKKRNYIEESTDTLMGGTIGVLADEVHYIGVPGMILLSQIWDSVQNQAGRGFPLFLIGSEVDSAIASAPELDTRISARANFHFLEGEPLLKAIKNMDGRVAATPDKLLLQMDRLYCKGRLRKWRTLMSVVNLNPANAGTAITLEQMRAFLVSQNIEMGRLKS